MRKTTLSVCGLLIAASISGTTAFGQKEKTKGKAHAAPAASHKFEYVAEQFADLQVLRYKVPGFDELTPRQKELCYYLSQAALCGRDIIYDQNFKYNLTIRRTLEAIIGDFKGDTKNPEYQKFLVYAKRVWFSNGIHHHYASKKIVPDCSSQTFAKLVKDSDPKKLPLNPGESVDAFVTRMIPIMFDPTTYAKKVNLDAGIDQVTGSANNFYEGVTQAEAEAFYKSMIEKANSATPISFGLNSKLVKENGVITERVWKSGGMYGAAIDKIVYWLEKAANVAENAKQKDIFTKLAEYYKTGDLKKWDEYNIAWVKDTESRIDAVNGFIEVYGDPLGYRANYESVVSIKDMEASKLIAAIGSQAQWFEDNSSIMPAHKKKNVKGISAKVITVVTEAGDAAPSTPIGINLPNANWIREDHGSKSVSLGNIVEAYDYVSSTGSALQEFAASPEEVDRAKKHGVLAGNLHTDMHEVIGHASGQINDGVGTPKETLKSYSSTLEEARADLVALYFMLDPKLIEIGVMKDLETGKAEYDGYIRNGMMTQLYRLDFGDNLEEAHMRNRQLVASWAFEKGASEKVIERISRNGKTYFVIRDYNKLRTLFGELLKEIQRVTSEGDYNAGKNLVETYGVKVDKDLHKEVKTRFDKLGIAPYKGFMQAKLVPVMEGGKIKDVKIEYARTFTEQMLDYGKNYSLLPNMN